MGAPFAGESDMLHAARIAGVDEFVARNPKANQENLKEMMGLFTSGKIKPHVSATYPLEKAADALNAMAHRQVKGKVVLTT